MILLFFVIFFNLILVVGIDISGPDNFDVSMDAIKSLPAFDDQFVGRKGGATIEVVERKFCNDVLTYH